MTDQPPCSCGCANTFSTKDADSDLARYRRDGPTSSTGALLAGIVEEGVEGATLLDIGAGIGAIQLELLGAGLASAQSVDASEAYVSVARAEAERRGLASRTDGQVGDFVALADAVGPADVVTLDKVVCCYPDAHALLAAAGGRARRMIGLVYPRESWWNRVGSRVFAVIGWVTRDPTRWYIHPVREIDEVLRRAGFGDRRELRRELVWHVVLYVRD